MLQLVLVVAFPAGAFFGAVKTGGILYVSLATLVGLVAGVLVAFPGIGLLAFLLLHCPLSPILRYDVQSFLLRFQDDTEQGKENNGPNNPDPRGS